MLLYEAQIINLQIMQPWHVHVRARTRAHTHTHSVFLPLAFSRPTFLVFCTIFEAMVGWLGKSVFCTAYSKWGGDPSLPIVASEHTCFCHRYASLEKVMQMYIKPSLKLQHKLIHKDYKDGKTKYHKIHSWWLSSRLTTKEGILNHSKWLGS